MLVNQVTFIDHDSTMSRTTVTEDTVPSPADIGRLEAIDKLTHMKITGSVNIEGLDISGATLKTSAETGTYSDRCFKLNLRFKEVSSGKIIPHVISGPKAMMYGGDANYIYLSPEDGGRVPAELPTGGVGMDGEDVAREVEIIKGYGPNELAFLSGSLTKTPR